MHIQTDENTNIDTHNKHKHTNIHTHKHIYTCVYNYNTSQYVSSTASPSITSSKHEDLNLQAHYYTAPSNINTIANNPTLMKLNQEQACPSLRQRRRLGQQLNIYKSMDMNEYDMASYDILRQVCLRQVGHLLAQVVVGLLRPGGLLRQHPRQELGITTLLVCVQEGLSELSHCMYVQLIS